MGQEAIRFENRYSVKKKKKKKTALSNTFRFGKEDERFSIHIPGICTDIYNAVY